MWEQQNVFKGGFFSFKQAIIVSQELQLHSHTATAVSHALLVTFLPVCYTVEALHPFPTDNCIPKALGKSEEGWTPEPLSSNHGCAVLM